MADIKLCADFRQCLLTVSADIARTISTIQHALDYVIYGRGSAFDVAHEVTIRDKNVWLYNNGECMHFVHMQRSIVLTLKKIIDNV